MLDLRNEARNAPLALPAVSQLDDRQRQAAIDEWTGRMVNEHVSARVFAALLPQMMAAGVDPRFQSAAADAAVEELRHARLCAAVVESLGGAALASVPELDEVPRHDDAEPLEALLRNVISISCLNETVAVALLDRGRQIVAESALRRIITEILADEVGHARLGWRMLDDLMPRTDAAMRSRLGAYLVPAFRQLFERHFCSAEAARPPAAQVVGVEDRLQSTHIFLEVVSDVILPRLATFGLPGVAAVRTALAARPASPW